MPSIFSKDTAEIDKLRREYAAEKEELIKQIGQLSVENAWLKKLIAKPFKVDPFVKTRFLKFEAWKDKPNLVNSGMG